MQNFSFTAVSGGDWTERMSGRNADTGAALTDLDTGEIQVQVQADGGSVLLNLTTEDGTITRTGDGEYQWVVPEATMASFCVGKTYYVGSRHINESGGITVLWTGSLAYIHGGYQWR